MAQQPITRSRAFAAIVAMALSFCLFGAVSTAFAAEQADGQLAAGSLQAQTSPDLSAYGNDAWEYLYEPGDEIEGWYIEAGYLGEGGNAEWRYHILGNGTVEIDSYLGMATTVVIPSVINGRTVTAIANFDVQGKWDEASQQRIYPAITSVTIPKTVVRIGENPAYHDAFINTRIAKGFTTGETKEERKVDLATANVFGTVGIYATESGVDKYGNSYTNEETAFVPTLKTFKVEKGNKKFKAVKGVLFNKKGTSLLAFPNAKKGKYTIPVKVKSVAPYAFRNATAKKVTTSKKMKTIGQKAFANSLVSSIKIVDGTKTIAKEAFYSAGYNGEYGYYGKTQLKLKKVSFPSSVKTIGESAFQYSSIKTVSLGSGVKTIGPWAFDGTRLKKVTVPGSVKTIGMFAFSDNPQMTKVKLGEGVKTIGVGAFEDVGIKTITIPSSVKSIKSSGKDSKNYIGGGGYTTVYTGNPFNTWYSDTHKKIDGTISWFDVTQPQAYEKYYDKNRDKASAKNFSNYVSCDKLTTIKVAAGNKKYTAQKGVLFNKKMTKLIAYPAAKKGSSYTLPKKVAAIGPNAFAFNQKLNRLKFNKKIKKIGDFAFYNTAMAAVAVPARVSSLGMGAFMSNSTTAMRVYNANLYVQYQAKQITYEQYRAARMKRAPLNFTVSAALATSVGCNVDYPNFPDEKAKEAFENSLECYKLFDYGMGRLGNYYDNGNFVSSGNYSEDWNALVSLI